ncbi:MAG: GNAT family protein [Methyloligellaceae bacterium]
MGCHLPFFFDLEGTMIEARPESGGHAAACGQAELALTTRRLILRQPVAGDTEGLVRIANNMAIAAQMSRLPHPFTLRDAESWIAAAGAQADPRDATFIILRRSDNAVAGAAALMPAGEGEVELSYFLAQPLWRQGYATEAAQAVVDHAFEALADIRAVVAHCRASNRASRRVLEKCGFQHYGSGMCACAALRSRFAAEAFILERSVWWSLKNWGRA